MSVDRERHRPSEATEAYSPAEERFNQWRRRLGLGLGPLCFLVLLVAPLPLSAPAHRLAGILAMMVIFWVSEALPLPVTALMGPVLSVVLGLASARSAFAPFADPVIFVFMGGFMLAEAMFVHQVDRRIAYTALSSSFVSASAGRVLLVYGGITAALSMWMSNTATTAMMYPIGLSIAAHLARTGGAGAPQFALAAMLMTAFAASIGGIATPVGTPPNLIGIGMIERLTGTDITFFQWMLIGLPVTVALFAFLGVYFQLTCMRGVRLTSGSTDAVRQELRTMGPVSPGQRNVLIAFGITVLLWITPGVLALARADQSAFGRAYAQMVPESVAAMLGALLLFVLPLEGNEGTSTLTWKQASRIDWGIILLYGGGLTMGELAFSTGLAEAMGKGITDWMPVSGTVSLTLLFTGVAIVLSEATSNTAAANMIIPIAIAVAQAAGVRPLEPALGATLGASMGFMMPVSTPPNAIVYGSGHVPLSAMIRYGLALDLAGFVVISAAVLLLGPLVF